jgi:hypothetical protein
MFQPRNILKEFKRPLHSNSYLFKVDFSFVKPSINVPNIFFFTFVHSCGRVPIVKIITSLNFDNIMGKRTKNDLQNTPQKTKDQATWTQLKTHVLWKGTLTTGVQSVIFVLRHHGFFGFPNIIFFTFVHSCGRVPIVKIITSLNFSYVSMKIKKYIFLHFY